METQVTTNSESKAVAALTGSWGAEDTNSEDLVLAKALVTQPTSKAIQKYNARPGELRSSLTGGLLAELGKELSFIPFYVFSTWVHSVYKNGKWEFESVEPRTKNSNYEYIEEENGQPKAKHERAINAYVLLPTELDENPAALPYQLTFKGAGTFQEGRKFSTLVDELKWQNLPPATFIFSVKTEQRTNDKGTFYTLNVARGDKTPAKHIEAAKQWYLRVTQSGARVKVDESGEE